MILSDKNIQEKLGHSIIIVPFNLKNVNPSSYDVTLGENYYEWNNNLDLTLYNPYNSEHVSKLWILNKARNCTNDEVKFFGCKPESKIIIVKPRQTILAHTNEFIGGLGNITTQMSCRSSFARNCITVCKCSNTGNQNYINRWCMEIENCGPYPVILTVGERIAQITFINTGETEKFYSGSYQNGNDISFIIKEWKPEMMIPKLQYD